MACLKCTNMSHTKESMPWVKGIAHMHRTNDDIKNNWDRMLWLSPLFWP